MFFFSALRLLYASAGPLTSASFVRTSGSRSAPPYERKRRLWGRFVKSKSDPYRGSGANSTHVSPSCVGVAEALAAFRDLKPLGPKARANARALPLRTHRRSRKRKRTFGAQQQRLLPGL